MSRKRRRLTLIGLAGIVLAVAAGLVLYALSDRIVFFNSPSDIRANAPAPGQRIRLGGLVAEGSVVKGSDGSVRFSVTDGAVSVPVAYRGILPDLFREGQGVVTEGVVDSDGEFSADTVLAKHDENYMPKESPILSRTKASGGHAEDAVGTQ
jgi:cytochrome c-type biogenesis protein CcmE